MGFEKGRQGKSEANRFMGREGLGGYVCLGRGDAKQRRTSESALLLSNYTILNQEGLKSVEQYCYAKQVVAGSAE